MTTVYFDESGFTGNNLLDQQQQYFVFAAVAIQPENAQEIISKAIRDYDVQGGELKGSRLLKYHKGRKAIDWIVQQCSENVLLATHHKKYALASKFFEYVFEPAISEQNSIFYSIGFHRFIANLMYFFFVAQDKSAESLLLHFSEMMCKLDTSRIRDAASQQLKVVDGSNIMHSVALFCLLNHPSIVEELITVEGVGAVAKWSLDLSTTSLFCLLNELAERHHELDVYCDKSKPLAASLEPFKYMIGREDRQPLFLFGKNAAIGFNLKKTPEIVDSKSYPGIQLADVFASAMSYIMLNRTEPQAAEWLARLLRSKSISSSNIMPDEDRLDLSSMDGFVNCLVLQELVDRSLRKENLLGNIIEFIESARSLYPQWLAENGASREFFNP